MIRSMTGYGKSEGVVCNRRTTIEARCVNGRYLEFSVKMPKEWSATEAQIRELAREHVVRGTLSLFIRAEESAVDSGVSMNMKGAEQFVEALRRMKDELRLSGDVTLDHVVAYPDLFTQDETPHDAEVLWKELSALLIDTLKALNEMRNREGGALRTDLELRLVAIEKGLVDVERMSTERIPMERLRLRERVRQVVDQADIDEQRLQLEITLLAEKLDVSEECVRLRSHIKHFVEYMDADGNPGRKLNFLLQEMNREVNTIGSKSNDAEIARIVVGMKEELERMREQIQNVE